MGIKEWLASSEQLLTVTGIATARLDCLVLLEDATGKDRAWLLAHLEQKLTSEQVSKLANKIDRRVLHEPLAYIRGKSEFYGREFLVTADTLEPRPETETMIELVLKLVKSNGRNVKEVVDVGTGSGCLAITVKLEFPETEVTATDISPACLKIALANAKKHGVEVELHKGNLLESISIPHSPFSVLLCNLPYVPDKYQLNKAATFEPKIAVFGGPDGLDIYRRLFNQLANTPHQPRYIFTEALPFQHDTLCRIALASGYHLEKTDDFIQCFRVT